jgi:hypothetical protein
MFKILDATAIFAASIYFYSCAASPDASNVPSVAKLANVNLVTVMQKILEKTVQQLPELKSAGITTGTSSSAEAWAGDEYATAGFMLAANAAYHPRELARKGLPHIALRTTVHRYVSPGAAQKDLERNLFARPAMAPPKETYKGATLYRYASGAGNVICQFNKYIIEISPIPQSGIKPSLVMKVLDVVMAELGSTTSRSK